MKNIKYPALNEWGLLGRGKDEATADAVHAALNKALSDTVAEMQSCRHATVGQAVAAIYRRLKPIHENYPTIGLFDSEPRDALSDFFEQVAPGTAAAFYFEETKSKDPLKLAA